MFNPNQDKLRLLDQIRMERDFLLRSLAGLTPEELERPETLGAWSVKGLLAHLTFWQQHILDVLARAARGEAPAETPYGLPDDVLDAITARVFEAARSRPLAVVWGEFHASFAQVQACVLALPEGTLFTPGVYPWLGELTIRDLLAANTCDHDHEHAGQLRRWRNESTVHSGQ